MSLRDSSKNLELQHESAVSFCTSRHLCDCAIGNVFYDIGCLARHACRTFQIFIQCRANRRPLCQNNKLVTSLHQSSICPTVTNSQCPKSQRPNLQNRTDLSLQGHISSTFDSPKRNTKCRRYFALCQLLSIWSLYLQSFRRY